MNLSSLEEKGVRGLDALFEAFENVCRLSETSRKDQVVLRLWSVQAGPMVETRKRRRGAIITRIRITRIIIKIKIRIRIRMQTRRRGKERYRGKGIDDRWRRE